METIGKRIKKARTIAEISVVELAKGCGVSRQAVYQWERDETIPTADNFISISELTGVSIKALVRGNEQSSGTMTKPTFEKSIVPEMSDLDRIAEQNDADKFARIEGAVLQLSGQNEEIMATLERFRRRFEDIVPALTAGKKR